jgi:hypothetical protein
MRPLEEGGWNAVRRSVTGTLSSNLRAVQARQMLTNRALLQRIKECGMLMSEPTLSRIMRGLQEPTISQAVCMTNALNVRLGEMLL